MKENNEKYQKTLENWHIFFGKSLISNTFLSVPMKH